MAKFIFYYYTNYNNFNKLLLHIYNAYGDQKAKQYFSY